jgi:hypothetical protein
VVSGAAPSEQWKAAHSFCTNGLCQRGAPDPVQHRAAKCNGSRPMDEACFARVWSDFTSNFFAQRPVPALQEGTIDFFDIDKYVTVSAFSWLEGYPIFTDGSAHFSAHPPLASAGFAAVQLALDGPRSIHGALPSDFPQSAVVVGHTAVATAACFAPQGKKAIFVAGICLAVDPPSPGCPSSAGGTLWPPFGSIPSTSQLLGA